MFISILRHEHVQDHERYSFSWPDKHSEGSAANDAHKHYTFKQYLIRFHLNPAIKHPWSETCLLRA